MIRYDYITKKTEWLFRKCIKGLLLLLYRLLLLWCLLLAAVLHIVPKIAVVVSLLSNPVAAFSVMVSQSSISQPS